MKGTGRKREEGDDWDQDEGGPGQEPSIFLARQGIIRETWFARMFRR